MKRVQYVMICDYIKVHTVVDISCASFIMKSV